MDSTPSYAGYSESLRYFGVAGALVVLYFSVRVVQSALATGQVYVGNFYRGMSSGASRFQEVYVPWEQASPLVAHLLFLLLCCVALAFPAARRVIGHAHPFVALVCGLLVVPLLASFCISFIGNVVYLIFGGLLFLLLRRLSAPIGGTNET